MGGKEVDMWAKLRGDDMTAWYDKEMYDRQRCDSCRRQVQAVREKYYGTEGGEIVVSDKLVWMTFVRWNVEGAREWEVKKWTCGLN